MMLSVLGFTPCAFAHGDEQNWKLENLSATAPLAEIDLSQFSQVHGSHSQVFFGKGYSQYADLTDFSNGPDRLELFGTASNRRQFVKQASCYLELNGSVGAFVIAPDARTIAVLTWAKSELHIFELPDSPYKLSEERPFKPAMRRIEAGASNISFDVRGRLLIERRNALTAIDLKSGVRTQPIGELSNSGQFEVSPNGRFVIVGESIDEGQFHARIRVLDLATDQFAGTRKFTQRLAGPHAIAISPSSSRFAMLMADDVKRVAAHSDPETATLTILRSADGIDMNHFNVLAYLTRTSDGLTDGPNIVWLGANHIAVPHDYPISQFRALVYSTMGHSELRLKEFARARSTPHGSLIESKGEWSLVPSLPEYAETSEPLESWILKPGTSVEVSVVDEREKPDQRFEADLRQWIQEVGGLKIVERGGEFRYTIVIKNTGVISPTEVSVQLSGRSAEKITMKIEQVAAEMKLLQPNGTAIWNLSEKSTAIPSLFGLKEPELQDVRRGVPRSGGYLLRESCQFQMPLRADQSMTRFFPESRKNIDEVLLVPWFRPQGNLVGNGPSYYVWYDHDGWHLRIAVETGRGRKDEKYLVVVRVDGGTITRNRPVGQKPDALSVDRNKQKLEFNFTPSVTTSGGLDFAVEGRNATVQFDLGIGKKTRVENVHIGRTKRHPSTIPFTMPANPSKPIETRGP